LNNRILLKLFQAIINIKRASGSTGKDEVQIVTTKNYRKFDKMVDSNSILSRINIRVQQIIPGAKVLLFGSRAYGEPTEESDWDILVLTKDKHPKTTKWLIQDKLFPISLEFSTFINLLLVQEEEWETSARYYSLRKNIGDNLIIA
jgi:predicted nucleotidyltransferase